MTITIYAHEVIPGSDVGLHFSATFALATAAAEQYHEAFRLMGAEPLGRLGIYEFTLTTPGISELIEILNSPEAVFSICLARKRIVGSVED
jgi:hypothetical protein